MNHVRFLSRLLNRPQMIAPAAGASVLAALMPGASLRGWDGEPDTIERDARAYGVVNGIAIIPIVGELVHRGASMDALSGLTSYQALGDMVSDALSDRKVTSIMLDVDSPGGEAGGCLDFAEWLGQQRGVKPIWASVNQRACSAAYAIASAADQILIGESALAGSIGVAWYYADLSAALAKEGVKVTFLYRGERKLAAHPALPLSDEDAAMIDRTIGVDYARFCSLVARHRDLSVEAVEGTEAGIFIGQDAIAAGLADSIATHEEALMALATHIAPAGARIASPSARAALLAGAAGAALAAPKTGGTPAPAAPASPPVDPAAPAPAAPAVPPAPPEPPAGDPPADPPAGPAPADVPPNPAHYDPPATNPFQPADPVAVAQACERAGFAQLTSGLLAQRATMAQVTARLTLASEIVSSARLLGQPAMGAELVGAGVSLETARKLLNTKAAEADAAIVTDPTNSDGPGKAKPALDAGAIYGRLNETITPQRRRA
ncbi:S49 family peptidase [Pararoseomonas sp. SCSIO 73927]|uniref:S49 family peptidase n=1 Tax=Pararoseomonas sp. SCSIO 73927 TaxID=3114537 RepID=UPI0030D5FF03